MPQFVTLEQANEHLRAGLDAAISESPITDPFAIDMENKVEEAEAHVLNFLKIALGDLDDSPAPLTGYEVNVRSAVLLVLSSLYDDREKAEMLSGLGTGNPSNPVVALLYRLRDPAIA